MILKTRHIHTETFEEFKERRKGKTPKQEINKLNRDCEEIRDIAKEIMET